MPLAPRHLAFSLMLAAAPAAQAADPSAATANDPVQAQVQALLAGATLDAQLSLVMSRGAAAFSSAPPPPGALGSAAFLQPDPSLHLPTLQITDAGLGVGNPGRVRKDDPGATSLPSGLAAAASFDTRIAAAGGAMIGREAWQKGFNVLLAGGINLVRDPRDERIFEYAGEDPLLAGRIVGATIGGIQAQHVISTVKHFAMNDLETGRATLSAQIDPAALRESDLLAFEIAIETGHPGAVMCSYNRVNDVYACENPDLLTTALRTDWHYPGFVMSDWGAAHSTVRAALAGLDQESSGDTIDAHPFFGPALQQAVRAGQVPPARLREMAGRVLHAVVATGLIEHPPVRQPSDFAADAAVAQRQEEAGAVLLRNQGGLIPLAPGARLAVIGGHADVGVISGGGSAQVMPVGGPAVPLAHPDGWLSEPVYDPSSPLQALRATTHVPVAWASGTDLAEAVRVAGDADIAVVFVTQWMQESHDHATLSLPDRQDALIEAVARANPRTIVVLETGGPVLMPWLDRVAGVLEAWYPGSGGGPAIARLLRGDVPPAGHLPLTFPKGPEQLPRTTIAGVNITDPVIAPLLTDQEVDYSEGADVGYRWFDRQHLTPLFPFGFGLSTTRFEYAPLHVTADAGTARLTVRNVGTRAGVAVPQLYVVLPDGGPQRLAGWARVALAPGESATLDVPIDTRLLARFDAKAHDWHLAAGRYTLRLSANAALPLQTVSLSLPQRRLAP